MNGPLVYELIVGDWSDDGHGKTDTFSLYSNLNPKTLYDAGSVRIGYGNIHAYHCSDYGSSELPSELVKRIYDVLIELDIDYGEKLKEIGFDEFDIDEFKFCVEDESGNFFDSTKWIMLYLVICMIGNHASEVVWTPKKVNAEPIRIGGYGLFE